MKTTILITLEIETCDDDGSDAMEAIESVLDVGTLQDAIREAAEMQDHDVMVTSALASWSTP